MKKQNTIIEWKYFCSRFNPLYKTGFEESNSILQFIVVKLISREIATPFSPQFYGPASNGLAKHRNLRIEESRRANGSSEVVYKPGMQNGMFVLPFE